MHDSGEKTAVICVGELLVDCIGQQLEATIEETASYQRYLGGSPANVAMNMAKLNCRVSLVAAVGKDGFGDFIRKELENSKVDINYLEMRKDHHTSVIFVSKTTGTPDFIPYRNADNHILPRQIPVELLSKAKIFHTTAFALSAKPARETILEKARQASESGCRLSVDFNYSEKIWSDRNEAIDVLKQYCQLDPLVKVSEDDIERLFEKTLSYKETFDFFHKIGAKVVCLTLGSKGVKLSEQNSDIISLPANKIEHIKDATGAGDAFWSGFLYGYLEGKKMIQCLKIGLYLAEVKLQHIGGLPENEEILQNIKSL